MTLSKAIAKNSRMLHGVNVKNYLVRKVMLGQNWRLKWWCSSVFAAVAFGIYFIYLNVALLKMSDQSTTAYTVLSIIALVGLSIVGCLVRIQVVKIVEYQQIRKEISMIMEYFGLSSEMEVGSALRKINALVSEKADEVIKEEMAHGCRTNLHRILKEELNEAHGYALDILDSMVDINGCDLLRQSEKKFGIKKTTE